MKNDLQKQHITIFWMRRDLRFEDNTALSNALDNKANVLVLFIFDKEILNKLNNGNDARVTFIYKKIEELKKKLETKGSSLLVKYDDPLNAFEKLLQEFNVNAVYYNHDYEPYAIRRDKQVSDLLKKNDIEVFSFKDQVIFEKAEVVKDDGKPYHVFTPYSKRWKKKLDVEGVPNKLVNVDYTSFLKTTPFKMPSMSELGFQTVKMDFPFSAFDLSVIRTYHENRNFPSIKGTSRLGIHLRFGTISIRKLVQMALDNNETFLNELIWREFFMMILWFYPKTTEKSFKPRYDNIQWDNNEDLFRVWCEGKTGYPIVDAGMRQLNETGFMHNRVRMIAASFLVKHLLIDWRWGEAYFAEKLLDYEQSSNVGNWQWIAGSGCDAAPYFRIFNPSIQAQKFDPKYEYINQWVPEHNTEQYPAPVVNHKKAREKALEVYKSALNQ